MSPVRLAGLLALALALRPAAAQTAVLSPYVGTWDVAVHGTPGGTMEGTYTVSEDGTGTLSLPSMGVADAPVTGIYATDTGFTGTTSFVSRVPGGAFTCALVFAPAPADALVGETDCGTRGAFATVARRSAAPETAALQQSASAVVAAFVAAARAATTADLGDAPAVQVANTPQAIWYSGATNTIVVPWWEGLPPPQRVALTAYGGNATADEALFRMAFNGFLLPHEAGHWLQARARPYGLESHVAAEFGANRLAVAFWKTQPGGEAFLDRVQQVTDSTLALMRDPTPAGMTPAQYFDDNYTGILRRDAGQYGYFQFGFIRDALAERDRLDLATLVADLVSGAGAPQSAARTVYEALQADGPEAARARFLATAHAPADEAGLNALGYALLGMRRTPDAVAVLAMTAEAFPDSPNAHDSYAEALAAAGRAGEARAEYARAVALAEAQADPRLEVFRANRDRSAVRDR